MPDPKADTLTVTDTNTLLTASGFEAGERGHWDLMWLDDSGNRDNVLRRYSGGFKAKPDGSWTAPFAFGSTELEESTGRTYGSAHATLTTDNVELEIDT